MTTSFRFEDQYPKLAEWVKKWGWIAIGADHFSYSMVRVLDIGGMIWESDGEYATVDDALREAEKAIAEWLEKNR